MRSKLLQLQRYNQLTSKTPSPRDFMTRTYVQRRFNDVDDFSTSRERARVADDAAGTRHMCVFEKSRQKSCRCKDAFTETRRMAGERVASRLDVGKQ